MWHTGRVASGAVPTMQSGVDSGVHLLTWDLFLNLPAFPRGLGFVCGCTQGHALYLAYPRDRDAAERPQHVSFHPRWWLKHEDAACTEQVHWHLREKVASMMSAFILGRQGVVDLKFLAILLLQHPKF